MILKQAIVSLLTSILPPPFVSLWVYKTSNTELSGVRVKMRMHELTHSQAASCTELVFI